MVDKNYTEQVFCAIDTDDCNRAKSLARAVTGCVGGVKVGVQFFSAHGPAGVDVLRQIGLPVFLDLKLLYFLIKYKIPDLSNSKHVLRKKVWLTSSAVSFLFFNIHF